MIARCARCQGTFTTDRFGLQTCPHCGSELLLSDPNAPPPGAAPPQPPAEPPAGGAEPPPGPPPSAPPPSSSGAGALPPPPPPPPGGYGPPPGGWPPPPGPGGWSGGGRPPGAPPVPELPSPFAERATRGWIAGFFETWKLVATQPQEFFRRVRIDQTGSAILFGVIASTVGNAVAALYNFLSGQQAATAMQEVLSRMSEEQASFMRAYLELMSGKIVLAQVVVSPLLTVAAMYVGSAILHLLLMLFRGANRPFDATLTAVAHANGLNLLLAVPGCGGLLAGVWGLVVLVIGLGEVQRCGTGKAAAAVLAPVALLCVCCCGALGLTVPAFLKALPEAAKQGQTTTL